MNEMIKININEQGQKLVSGRELHEVLEIGTRFDKWINRMIDYGFQENVDYTLVVQKRPTNNPKNPYTEVIEYILTLEMAKHIAMVQRTEIGMQVRNYFLECEKQVKENQLMLSVEDRAVLNISRATDKIELALAIRDYKEVITQPLIETIEIQKPKAEAFDQYINADGTYTVTNVAKMLNFKRSDLFTWLRDKELVFKNKSEATVKGIDKGYFRQVVKAGYSSMVVTVEGVEYIRNNFNK